MFLYQKTIDRSTLRQGFQIPVEYHDVLKATPGAYPSRGETRNIKIIIDGEEYNALLKKQAFDLRKYEGHADMIQIRYSGNSPLSKRLRKIFAASWHYVERIKNLPENQNRKLTIRIPDDQQEYLALSVSSLPNVFIAECIIADIKQSVNWPRHQN